MRLQEERILAERQARQLSGEAAAAREAARDAGARAERSIAEARAAAAEGALRESALRACEEALRAAHAEGDAAQRAADERGAALAAAEGAIAEARGAAERAEAELAEARGELALGREELEARPCPARRVAGCGGRLSPRWSAPRSCPADGRLARAAPQAALSDLTAFRSDLEASEVALSESKRAFRASQVHSPPRPRFPGTLRSNAARGLRAPCVRFAGRMSWVSLTTFDQG
jgi:hypothetical protein